MFRSKLIFLFCCSLIVTIHPLLWLFPTRLAEEEKKNIQLMQEAERTYAAEQVFGEWLDQVDKRQNKQTDKFHKQDQRTQHQFPWWPGGSIHLYTK
jgi:hypothetical protein